MATGEDYGFTLTVMVLANFARRKLRCSLARSLRRATVVRTAAACGTVRPPAASGPTLPGIRRRLGSRCYYAGDVAVASGSGHGYTLAATADLPAGTVLLVEQALAPQQVPAYLHPRRAVDVPLILEGCLLGLLPGCAFGAWPDLMAALRISLNSFGSGSYLYEVTCKTNHSCCPNAESIPITEDDGLQAVVTLTDVSKGEEVTLSYASREKLRWPTWRRRTDLLSRFGFWCDCCRCRGTPGSPRQREGWLPQRRARSELVLKAVALMGRANLDACPVVSLQECFSRRVEQKRPLLVLQAILTSAQLLLALVLLLFISEWFRQGGLIHQP